MLSCAHLISTVMATTLFGDFSFAPAPRRFLDHQEIGEYDDDSALSPLSPASPRLMLAPTISRQPAPCDMGDLTDALHQQNLRIQVVDTQLPSVPSTSQTIDRQTSLSPTSTSTSRLNYATRRMQRQANIRMLSSTSHAHELAKLVQKMIEADDQCTICERTAVVDHEDEGVDMGFSPLPVKQTLEPTRPASSSPWRLRVDDHREDAVRVSKRPRMRKSRAALKVCAK